MNYSTKSIEPNMVKALLVDAPISTKTAIEISNHIRGRSIEKARTILNLSIDLKRPIPFKRFTNGPGHKRGKGIASGRYKIKTCKQFLELLLNAESNARDKGLNTNGLVIKTLIVQRASQPWHYGRQSRIKMKRSHVELILQEPKADSKDKKEQTKKEVKTEKKSKQTSKDSTSSAKEQHAEKKVEKTAEKKGGNLAEKKVESKPKTETPKESTKKAETKPVTVEPTKKTEQSKLKDSSKETKKTQQPQVNEKMLKG